MTLRSRIAAGALLLAGAWPAPPAAGQSPAAPAAPVGWGELAVADQVALLRGLEARRLAARLMPAMWVGFDPDSIPLLLFRPGKIALLIGHPDPPDGYQPLAGSPAKAPVHLFRGKDPRLTASTAVAIRGVMTALYDLGPARGRAEAGGGSAHPPAETVIGGMLHEMFHAFSASKPAKQVPGGAWGRYPDSSTALARLNLEGRILSSALLAPDPEGRELARWFVAVRLRRWSEVGAGLAAAEATDEFEEGLATYTEIEAISRGASAGTPVPQLPGIDSAFASYRFGEVLRQAKLAGLLDQLDSFSEVRRWGYLAGAVQAMLLDRFDPDWREGAFRPEVTLIDLLAAASGFAAADPVDLLSRAESRFAFPALLQLAHEDLGRIAGRREQVLKQFLDQPGFIVRVRLPANGVSAYRYDPQNQSDPGGRRILHQRYLELDLPGGRFSAMDVPSLTVYGTSPPDVREVWFVVGEDSSWTLDGTIIYPRPGSLNGKESVRIEAPGLELEAGGAHLYVTGREVEVTLSGAG